MSFWRYGLTAMDYGDMEVHLPFRWLWDQENILDRMFPKRQIYCETKRRDVYSEPNGPEWIKNKGRQSRTDSPVLTMAAKVSRSALIRAMTLTPRVRLTKYWAKAWTSLSGASSPFFCPCSRN